MSYLIKYVFQKRRRFKAKRATWLQEKINRKYKRCMFYANVNINLMIENVIQIKSGIIINVSVSVKNIMYVKTTTFGILLHVAAKMANI